MTIDKLKSHKSNPLKSLRLEGNRYLCRSAPYTQQRLCTTSKRLVFASIEENKGGPQVRAYKQ